MSYFSLEGLVGSGKSSVLKILASFLKKEKKPFSVVSEPVFLFTKYQEGVYNPLVEMQKDPTRNMVTAQMHILTQSRDYYSRALLTDSSSLIVSDRSIFSCYAFIDCYFRKKYFTRFSKDFMINMWREECERVHSPDCFIFIDTPPEKYRNHLIDDSQCSFLDRTTGTQDFLTDLRCSHEKMFSITDVPVDRVEVAEHMTPADVAMAV